MKFTDPLTHLPVAGTLGWLAGIFNSVTLFGCLGLFRFGGGSAGSLVGGGLDGGSAGGLGGGLGGGGFFSPPLGRFFSQGAAVGAAAMVAVAGVLTEGGALLARAEARRVVGAVGCASAMGAVGCASAMGAVGCGGWEAGGAGCGWEVCEVSTSAIAALIARPTNSCATPASWETDSNLPQGCV